MVANMNKIVTDIESVKKKVTNINEYFADCAFSKKWSDCKSFTDDNKNRKMLVIPRNEDEKWATWEKSQEICNKHNASLVDIESQQKQLILEAFLGQFGKQYEYGDWFWTS